MPIILHKSIKIIPLKSMTSTLIIILNNDNKIIKTPDNFWESVRKQKPDYSNISTMSSKYLGASTADTITSVVSNK